MIDNYTQMGNDTYDAISMDELISDLEEYFAFKLGDYEKEHYLLKWIKEDYLFPNEIFAIFHYTVLTIEKISFEYMDHIAKNNSRNEKEVRKRKIYFRERCSMADKKLFNEETIKTLDDRALRYYRRHITQFHQECLCFDKCYLGDPNRIFHEHFKELEKIFRTRLREEYYKTMGVLPKEV